MASSSTQPIDKYFTSDTAIDKQILTFSSLYNLNFIVENRWSYVFKLDEILKSIIEAAVAKLDEAYYLNYTIKPFIITKNILKDNWRLFINKGIKDRMEFIESTFNADSELERETVNKLIDEITIIISSYDKYSENYETVKNKLDKNKLKLWYTT